MAGLQLKNIQKIYGKDVLAVEDFNLDIADREFIVLVGPSGCGKSTTLRMVAGLEDITSGDLYIDGKRMNDVASKDRDIAMVFQSYALYPHMSVFDNMAFALKLRKTPKAEIKRAVEEAAAILEITELLNRKPKALSGGQRQRVAIGRAIVRQPKVFLMDEPLSNLDAKLRNQMRTEIIRLRKRINTTFIYVTHDQVEAMTLGDRIVIMNAGKIQQIGAPREVFQYPANKFVAGFIGVPQMNFMPGKLAIREGVYSVSCCGVEIPLHADMQTRLKQSSRKEGAVTVGIRPEHLRIVAENEADSTAINATLTVCELMGSEVYLHVDLPLVDTVQDADEAEVGAKKDIVIRIPTMEAPDAATGLASGKERIRFALPPDFIHLFDVETEENIVYPYNRA